MLHKTESGEVRIGWIGEVDAGTTARVGLRRANEADLRPAQWKESETAHSVDHEVSELLSQFDQDHSGDIGSNEIPATHPLATDFANWDGLRQRDQADGRLSTRELRQWVLANRESKVSVGDLLALAAQQLRLLPGEYRLVAWTDHAMEGLELQPAPPQELFRTMVLVHLRQGTLKTPRADWNRYADVGDLPIRDSNEQGDAFEAPALEGS